eukprot:TRINITY_DN2523_c0_g1_i2.p1 TRINITY_DN2523_c0_g1~~TRINITY_DN2523_c0_g1_i2.p1  ORF type:complete len:346 (+),score=113.79 TRINITY_DN2523_c0_g1_i2:147-1040(+)
MGELQQKRLQKEQLFERQRKLDEEHKMAEDRFLDGMEKVHKRKMQQAFTKRAVLEAHAVQAAASLQEKSLQDEQKAAANQQQFEHDQEELYKKRLQKEEEDKNQRLNMLAEQIKQREEAKRQQAKEDVVFKDRALASAEEGRRQEHEEKLSRLKHQAEYKEQLQTQIDERHTLQLRQRRMDDRERAYNREVIERARTELRASTEAQPKAVTPESHSRTSGVTAAKTGVARPASPTKKAASGIGAPPARLTTGGIDEPRYRRSARTPNAMRAVSRRGPGGSPGSAGSTLMELKGASTL